MRDKQGRIYKKNIINYVLTFNGRFRTCHMTLLTQHFLGYFLNFQTALKLNRAFLLIAFLAASTFNPIPDCVQYCFSIIIIKLSIHCSYLI